MLCELRFFNHSDNRNDPSHFVTFQRTYHCLLYESHTCKSNLMDGESEGAAEGLIDNDGISEGAADGFADVLGTSDGDDDGKSSGLDDDSELFFTDGNSDSATSGDDDGDLSTLDDGSEPFVTVGRLFEAATIGD